MRFMAKNRIHLLACAIFIVLGLSACSDEPNLLSDAGDSEAAGLTTTTGPPELTLAGASDFNDIPLGLITTLSELSKLRGTAWIAYPHVDPPEYAALSFGWREGCLLYTSPSPRDRQKSRMPSSA